MIHDTDTDSELEWFKSSYSSSEGDSCVEVATTPGTVHVRDSKFRDTSPPFALTAGAWSEFVTYALGS